MQLTIGTAPVKITSGVGRLRVQNLSAGPVFYARSAAVAASGSQGGLQLAAGALLEFPSAPASDLFLVCDTGQTAVVAYDTF